MSRRHRRKLNDTSATATADAIDDARSAGIAHAVRRWLLAGVATLFVALPLVVIDGNPWIGSGQPFTMFWIILTALWLLGAVGQRRFTVRWTWLDTIAAAFFGWWMLSAAIAMKTGAPRPTVNMLCDGGGMLLAVLLVRQLAPTPTESRALIAVMIALAVALACLALYQYFVVDPAQRAQFKIDPQAMLHEAGWEGVQPGSADFKRFADRLNSPEPIGTFSLTNSLAAFLAPWLIMTLGIGLFGSVGVPPSGGVERPSRSRWRTWLASAAIGATIAAALALTHSRSAWIGTTIGVVALIVWRRSLNNRKTEIKPRASGPQWRGAIIGLFLLVTTMISMIVVWLPAILAPALKSFQFRLEYWQATLAMIRDHLVWGVGPGNFQNAYIRYKLPISSEEVLDPHNFLLELAANAGVPAAIAFVALIGGFARRIWRFGAEPASPDVSDNAATQPNTVGWICGGAVAGLGLAILLNRIWGFEPRLWENAAGVVIGAAVIALLWPWIQKGRAPAGLYLVGIGVLLIALLAVGGMTIGGVSGSLWLLIALGLNATDPGAKQAFHPSPFTLHSSTHLLPQWAAWLLFAALTVAAIAQFQIGYYPAFTSRLATNNAIQAADNRRVDEAEKDLLAAAASDPWAVEPLQFLAQRRLAQWKRIADPSKREGWHLKDFKTLTDAMLSANPNSSELWAVVGQQWLDVYHDLPKEPGYGRLAVQCFTNAAALYPTSAERAAQLADALAATGDLPHAKEAAQNAQRLDDLMPHEDRKLTAEQRAKLSCIISGEKP